MLALILPVLASAVAIGVEYLYRTLPGPWISHLWIWIPAQLFIGFAIYTMVKVPNTPLVVAFITWSATTLVLRVGVSMFVLHDRIAPGTWVAVALLVLAKISQQVWK